MRMFVKVIRLPNIHQVLKNRLYLEVVYFYLFLTSSKGSCSMFGAWGDAIPKSDGLLQLRALDWVTDGMINNNVVIKK